MADENGMFALNPDEFVRQLLTPSSSLPATAVGSGTSPATQNATSPQQLTELANLIQQGVTAVKPASPETVAAVTPLSLGRDIQRENIATSTVQNKNLDVQQEALVQFISTAQQSQDAFAKLTAEQRQLESDIVEKDYDGKARKMYEDVDALRKELDNVTSQRNTFFGSLNPVLYLKEQALQGQINTRLNLANDLIQQQQVEYNALVHKEKASEAWQDNQIAQEAERNSANVLTQTSQLTDRRLSLNAQTTAITIEAMGKTAQAKRDDQLDRERKANQRKEDQRLEDELLATAAGFITQTQGLAMPEALAKAKALSHDEKVALTGISRSLGQAAQAVAATSYNQIGKDLKSAQDVLTMLQSPAVANSLPKGSPEQLRSFFTAMQPKMLRLAGEDAVKNGKQAPTSLDQLSLTEQADLLSRATKQTAKQSAEQAKPYDSLAAITTNLKNLQERYKTAPIEERKPLEAAIQFQTYAVKMMGDYVQENKLQAGATVPDTQRMIKYMDTWLQKNGASGDNNLKYRAQAIAQTQQLMANAMRNADGAVMAVRRVLDPASATTMNTNYRGKTIDISDPRNVEMIIKQGLLQRAMKSSGAASFIKEEFGFTSQEPTPEEPRQFLPSQSSIPSAGIRG